MGDKAVASRRNLRNAMSRGGVGSMTPAKETAERREKHKAARGVKTKGMSEGMPLLNQELVSITTRRNPLKCNLLKGKRWKKLSL